jgi:hypothetical protein
MNLQELLKSFEGKKSSGGFNDVKFFSLKDDGDKATVKILLRNEQDILKFAKPLHMVEINGYQNKVLCLNNPGEDDKCECCNAGIKRQLKIMLPLYNVETKQVELWERGINQIKDLQVMLGKYGDLSQHTFEIIRSGKAKSKDTKYTMMYDPTQVDVNVDELQIPEITGRNFKLILDLSMEQQKEAMLEGKVTWGKKEEVTESTESDF